MNKLADEMRDAPITDSNRADIAAEYLGGEVEQAADSLPEPGTLTLRFLELDHAK